MKKALSFTECYLSRYKLNVPNNLSLVIQQGKKAFAQVKDVCSPTEIERFRVNPLFKEYARAINVAKLILKRFGYDVQKIEKQTNMIPPFWMDMSTI